MLMGMCNQDKSRLKHKKHKEHKRGCQEIFSMKGNLF